MVLFRKITPKKNNQSLKYFHDVKINLKVAEYKNVRVNEFNNIVKFNDGKFLSQILHFSELILNMLMAQKMDAIR